MKGEIPTYGLNDFRHIHREPTQSTFGYDNLDASHRIAGFELYSSKGLVGSVGPLRSDFYRLSVTCKGGLDMQIGLEHYQHQERTISFTYPNQLFAKNNITAQTFGYYLLFSKDFLNELVSEARIAMEFPFASVYGLPVFRVSEEELERIINLLFKIDQELKQQQSGKTKAVQMYLYLVLLELKRSYQRQQLDNIKHPDAGSRLVSAFIRLLSVHYLSLRQVSDYAGLLAVTPDYLNRTVKNVTGNKASETIKSMMLLEAKAQLRYTDKTISEIAYHIGYSDPAAFNRFFRTATGGTPLDFRKKTD